MKVGVLILTAGLALMAAELTVVFVGGQWWITPFFLLTAFVEYVVFQEAREDWRP